MPRRLGIALVTAAVLLVGSNAAALSISDVSMSVEGGASRFTGPLGRVASSGSTWALRLQVHALPWLSYGAAYEGSANRIGGGGDQPLQLLTRDGASAFLRLSTGRRLFEPFAEAGLGVARLSASAGPRFRGSSAADIPLAAGVLLHAGAVNFGLRLGFHLLPGNDVYAGGGGTLLTSALIVGARF